MNGFTFLKDYYEVIKKMRKQSDKQVLTYAIIEFVFDGKESKELSEVAEIAFESFRKSLEKSMNNAGRGGRKSKKRIETELKPICNRIETDFQPNVNRFLTEKEKISLLENEEKSAKKEDKDNTLVKEKESKKERNLKDNNNNACTCEGACYEDIISHYAGDIDEDTRSAIWKYIQYFQAHTGCFILNEQLKTFLVNVKNMGLNFEGGIIACINSNGIGMAMREMNI